MWMPVDNRLNFFRVDLQPADIDHTIAPSDEMVTIGPQLEHIGCVDEPVRIPESASLLPQVTDRSSIGADAKRTVLDFHFDTGRLADNSHWKARETIVNRERDTGLR